MRPLVHLNECVFHHQCDPLEQYTSTLLQHVWGQCRRCEAGLLINQPVQSRRVDTRRARRAGLSVVFRHGPRRSSRYQSNACARRYTLRRSEPKVLVLQVNVTGRRLRRPAAATSDFRTLGRRAAEIRTGRRIGVETGHWHIRLGPRGGAEAAAASRLGAPSSPVSRLALACGERWHAACSPQS